MWQRLHVVLAASACGGCGCETEAKFHHGAVLAPGVMRLYGRNLALCIVMSCHCLAEGAVAPALPFLSQACLCWYHTTRPLQRQCVGCWRSINHVWLLIGTYCTSAAAVLHPPTCCVNGLYNSKVETIQLGSGCIVRFAQHTITTTVAVSSPIVQQPLMCISKARAASAARASSHTSFRVPFRASLRLLCVLGCD